MSEEPVKPAASAAPAGAKTSKLVVALLVLNLGASGFGTFKLVTAPPGAPARAADAPAAPPTNAVTGPVHALAPFVVNLDEPGQSRYLKVTIQFELVKKDVEAQIEKNKEVIRDAILSHLSGLKLADTLGTAAKDKLRTDVLAKAETILGKDKLRRVFFQEFVVQ